MSETTLPGWQEQFVKWLTLHWAIDDGAHDIHHLHKVWQNCCMINEGETEKGDQLILLTAAYFHDIVSLPKNHPERASSSLLSANKTKQLLEEVFTGFPAEKIGGICHAIHAHSFSANIETLTTEAKILQDADRMEALGATGIARLFYTAGKMNAALYHVNDPLAINRMPDDKQYALDHIEIKLLNLPAGMKTTTGKKIAEKETMYIREFRKKLVEEIASGSRQ